MGGSLSWGGSLSDWAVLLSGRVEKPRLLPLSFGTRWTEKGSWGSSPVLLFPWWRVLAHAVDPHRVPWWCLFIERSSSTTTECERAPGRAPILPRLGPNERPYRDDATGKFLFLFLWVYV